MPHYHSLTDALNAAEVRRVSPETRERIDRLREADRGVAANIPRPDSPRPGRSPGPAPAA